MIRSPALDSGRPNVEPRVSVVPDDAVVGVVDAVDVVAIEQVERLPNQLHPLTPPR